MKITYTQFKGLLIIETDVYDDDRGWFSETYTKSKFAEQGMEADFIQDNHSYSCKKNTLRGIHFQINPMAQTKITRCTRGAIIDIAVDLRKGSDTYKKWFSIELSSRNKKQLYIPKGFGHAFLTLTDDVEVQYKVDKLYSFEHDRSIKYDDPEINIEWGLKNPILSSKDLNAPLLKDSDVNFSTKVLVTGANGQLGYDVLRVLNTLAIEGIGVDIADFDITNKEDTEAFILQCKPDIVVHCAAYTSVDQAEDAKELCYAVNVNGTKHIAEACKKIDAKMVFISTDYVFAGEGEEAQLEEQSTNPINYYGYSKEQGEIIVRNILEKHFIIRTSWLYGKNGNNFVKTMVKMAAVENEINVVNDQMGAPTYTADLAGLICSLMQTTKYGTYHGVNEGCCSWYQFAVEIFRLAEINIRVIPITTLQYLTKSCRPHNSRLAKGNIDKIGLERLPDWENALVRYLRELLGR